MAAIGKVSKYMQSTDYEENILELGAYIYQFFGKEQDFAELYDILCAEEPAESEGVGVVVDCAAGVNADVPSNFDSVNIAPRKINCQPSSFCCSIRRLTS